MLFENSIVCHVFYAMALGLRVILVVCGFWGLFCFGLPGPLFLGLGWAWSGFLDCCTDFGFWLTVFVVGWGLNFVGFVWRV